MRIGQNYLEDTHPHLVTRNDRKILGLVLILTMTYLIIEVIGGILSNSVSLLSDAGHMVSDVGGISISLIAITLSCRKASPERPFGLIRLEILAAMINGILLIIIDIYILYESYIRLFSPREIQSSLMIAVATGGLIINILSALIISKASKRSLNIRSAFIHVLSDALTSVGVIVSGIIIYFTNYYLVDALAGFFIGIMMIPSIYSLLNESLNILLESCPIDVGIPEVKKELMKIKDVKDIHDLLIWSISSGIRALSVHILIDNIKDSSITLKATKQMLVDKFGIHHATLQIEDICEEQTDH